MPLYDRSCPECGATAIDCWEKIDTPPVRCLCGGITQRVWLAKPPSVIGDEIDIWAQHGLCNPDGSPRRYTSRQAMQREAEKRGYQSHVEHVGERGSDKSKHTVKWT